MRDQIYSRRDAKIQKQAGPGIYSRAELIKFALQRGIVE
jgi:hypothetical protein